jgi:type VI secretion system secreted protein VgrG
MTRMLEISTTLGADAFVVQRFSGREELGRMFEYHLELLSERADITAEQLLGTNATVGLELIDGQSTRYFNGYVSRFSVQGAVGTTAFKSNVGYLYLLTLSPGLWFMTRSANSRIFSQTTIGDLVTKLLKADTLMDLDPGSTTTEQRDYIVQYRETDFNFVTRLMEHAGVYYYFTHENGKHKMVLLDDVGSHKVLDALPSFTFSGPEDTDGTLSSLVLVSEVQPGAFAGGDYNYVMPNTTIAAVDSHPKAHDNAGYEMFDHPLETTTSAWAATYAKIRSEEMACGHAVAHGRGTERTLQVGFKTTVAQHSIDALNREFIIIGHSFDATNNLAQSADGDGAAFVCSFEAIPSDVQFRTMRTVAKPVIAGVQTALVVSEFHNDTDSSGGSDPIGANMGRVKVEFFWDRYGKQSCWARVSQPWAGKGYGFQNMPRVGEEVLVQFIEGDPDRPVVVGRVYNAENMPPFKLPANASITGLKTLSIDGQGNSVAGKWNELRFDDRDGAEQVYIQAQKDYDRRVLNDAKTWVGNEAHNYVAKDAYDKFDADHHVVTTGDNNHKVDGSLSFKVKADTHLDAGHKFAAKASDEIHLDGGQKVVIEASTKLSLVVGGNFIDISTSGISIVGTMVNVNSGGSAGTGSPIQPIAAKDAKIAMKSEGGSKVATPQAPTPPTAFSPQASSFKVAAITGAPLVAVCENC